MRTAVHTRRIVDPLWGAKITGSAGRVSFAHAGRGRRGAGRSSIARRPIRFRARPRFQHRARPVQPGPRAATSGAIVTDTEFAGGHNRVAGGDVSWRLSPARSASPVRCSDRSTRRRDDGRARRPVSAARRGYAYRPSGSSCHRLRASTTTPGFQMDTAFLNQVGITQRLDVRRASFYPDEDEDPWLRADRPFSFARDGSDRIQDGDDLLDGRGRARCQLHAAGLLAAGPVRRARDRGPAQRFHSATVARSGRRRCSAGCTSPTRSSGIRPIVYYDPVDPYPGDSHTYRQASRCSRAAASPSRSTSTASRSIASDRRARVHGQHPQHRRRRTSSPPASSSAASCSTTARGPGAHRFPGVVRAEARHRRPTPATARSSSSAIIEMMCGRRAPADTGRARVASS